jgi:hypothetical protein
VQQRLSRSFILLVHLLQLEGIEPDPTAATLADIHGEVPDLDLGQLIETGWTFHDLASAQKTSHAGRRFATRWCLPRCGQWQGGREAETLKLRKLKTESNDQQQCPRPVADWSLYIFRRNQWRRPTRRVARK